MNVCGIRSRFSAATGTRTGGRTAAVRAALLVTVLAAMLLPARPAAAFPPEKPYDPRPLLAEVEKKTLSDKYTFLVFGDSKLGDGLLGVLAQAEKLQPQFVLVTGDMVAVGGNRAEWDKFEKQMGPFMRKVPSFPCLGNHETKGKGAADNYAKFYGSLGINYAFDFRNMRLVMLAAEEDPMIAGKQLTWAEQQLAEGQKAGKLLFVMQHCPCYSLGIKGPQHIPNRPSPISTLCAKYGVVANFSGHEHMYYRTKRDGGVTFITQAAGGAWVYPLRRESAALKDDVYFGGVPDPNKAEGSISFKLHTPAGEKSYKEPKYQVTAIDVDGGKVTGRTICADGEVIDTFTLVDPSAPKPAAPAGASGAPGAAPGATAPAAAPAVAPAPAITPEAASGKADENAPAAGCVATAVSVDPSNLAIVRPGGRVNLILSINRDQSAVIVTGARVLAIGTMEQTASGKSRQLVSLELPKAVAEKIAKLTDAVGPDNYSLFPPAAADAQGPARLTPAAEKVFGDMLH